MTAVDVLAISGSLRSGSHNTAVAHAAAAAAPHGVDVRVYDTLADVPPYDQDLDASSEPDGVARLRHAVHAADAVLFVTPEYNGSVPGVLKNAVDWLSRPRGEAALMGKTVTVAGASVGQYGALWAQADLRRILGVAGARVVEDELPIARAGERLPGGAPDDETRGRLAARMRALVAASGPDTLAA